VSGLDSVSWGEVFVWGFVCGFFGALCLGCCLWLGYVGLNAARGVTGSVGRARGIRTGVR
jgi:hypothetical protein